MTTSVTDFLDKLDNPGAMTPQQAAALLELAQGDTDVLSSDEGGAPATTAATELPAEGTGVEQNESNSTSAAPAAPATPAPAAATPAVAPAAAPAAATPAEQEPDPANTVILAKDGKHTIPFAKLEEARQGEKHWKGIAEAAHTQLEQLQAQAATRAAAGDTPTPVDNKVAAATAAIDAGVDPAIFGDFSEKELSAGIAKVVDMKVGAQLAALLAPLQAEVDGVKQAIAPLQTSVTKTAEEAHFEAISAKHPDHESLVESQELADWIGKQPTFLQGAYRGVLEKGTATEVIELFDKFKEAAGVQTAAPAAAPSPAAVAAAAKAVIAATAPAVPASLTDIPGGHAGGQTPEAALASKSAPDMLEQMMGMSPEQIETFLNRRL